MQQGKESTVKDLRNIYGTFAKLNGTIGSVSEYGTTDASIEDEVNAKKQITEKTVEEEQGLSIKPDQNSRLSNANLGFNPVGIRPSPVDPGTSGTDIASINPNTRARGVEVFGADDAIFGMAQGGIMNARKPMQRVA